MTDQEYLDDVSKEAVSALAEALQESLCEGAQTAVQDAMEPIKTELSETSHQLGLCAGEMRQALEDAGEKLQRESQASLSGFLHEEALPLFTDGLDRAMETFPNIQSGITSIQASLEGQRTQVQGDTSRIQESVDTVVANLPVLQKGLTDLDGSVESLRTQIQADTSRIQESVDTVVADFPSLQQGLADLDAKNETLHKKTTKVIGGLVILGGLAMVLQIWILWILYHPRGIR